MLLSPSNSPAVCVYRVTAQNAPLPLSSLPTSLTPHRPYSKLFADDVNIFMGLLNDLFPKTAEQVPRAVDAGFETKVQSDGGWVLE